MYAHSNYLLDMHEYLNILHLRIKLFVLRTFDIDKHDKIFDTRRLCMHSRTIFVRKLNSAYISYQIPTLQTIL